MSTYTRRSQSSQGQRNITGKRHGNTQAQHGVASGGRADKVDWPFPNKPVSHRRPLNSRTQGSLDLYDFEKLTITKQRKGPLSPQEDHSNGIRQTTECQHPREDSHRLPRIELQLAKEIQAKELILQEKLWKVGEKIRQKIQRDSVDTPEEGRLNRGRAETKTRLYEQERREPMRGREMMMQERRQEDVKQLRTKQDQRNEGRMRNTHEEERATWKRREIEVAQSPQLQRKEFKATHEITCRGQEVSGELNKLRTESVKKYTGRRGRDEKDHVIKKETSVKLQDRTEDREQNRNSMVDKGWTREEKYRERTCKELYGSDDERDVPQMSQQQTSRRVATENHRGAGRKLSGEPLLPPVLHSGRPEQGKLRVTDNTDSGPQLLPCRICNRKFASQRLEVHVQICKKLKQSHRQVFNSYVNRTKGSAIEEFWKTHSRSKTPEVSH